MKFGQGPALEASARPATGTGRWPRLVPRGAECANKLAGRTLTKFCNESPAWFVNAHRKLDEGVFAAYGWPTELTGEQTPERLLALNVERAGGNPPTRTGRAQTAGP
jgi:hypothetical protein